MLEDVCSTSLYLCGLVASVGTPAIQLLVLTGAGCFLFWPLRVSSGDASLANGITAKIWISCAVGVYGTGILVLLTFVAARLGWSSHPDSVLLLMTIVNNTLIILGVSITAFCLLAMSASVMAVSRLGLSGIGLRRPSASYRYAAGVFVAGLLLTIAMRSGFTWHPVNPFVHGDATASGRRPTDTFFILMWIGITFGAIAEEILFRGLLLPLYRARFGVFAAVVLQALAFGLMHEPATSGELTVISADGVVFGASYALTGTLVVPILIHVSSGIIGLLFHV